MRLMLHLPMRSDPSVSAVGYVGASQGMRSGALQEGGPASLCGERGLLGVDAAGRPQSSDTTAIPEAELSQEES